MLISVLKLVLFMLITVNVLLEARGQCIFRKGECLLRPEMTSSEPSVRWLKLLLSPTSAGVLPMSVSPTVFKVEYFIK